MPSARRPTFLLSRLALATATWTILGAPTPAQQAIEPNPPLRAEAPDASSPEAAALPDLPNPTNSGDNEKKPKPKRPARPRPKPSDLPALRPYRGAQRMGLRGGLADPSVDAAGQPINLNPPGPTVAAAPTPPPRRKIPPDPDPYAPTGLRVGDMVLKTYVEQDGGYADNPLGINGHPKGSPVETTETGVDWQSDWSRDDFHGELKGGYTDYFATPEASGAYGSGVADARLDATRDLAFDAEGRFTITPQPLSNFGVTAPANSGNTYVTVATYGATAGGAQKFGALTLALHGSLDRTEYENGPPLAGATAGLSADDYDDWGLRGRASYRISEVVSPFAEFVIDTRRYDGVTDALGYQRNSTGVLGRAGVTLAFSQLLTGEASLGYGERDYQDPRLPRADAPLIDASLIWSVTPLTTLTFKTQSSLNDSILAGASADINRTYTIDLTHALTRALSLGLTGTYSTDDYVGSTERDTSMTIGAKAEYHLNRDVVLKASATRQIYSSNQPNVGSVNDVFLLGVRLQR